MLRWLRELIVHAYVNKFMNEHDVAEDLLALLYAKDWVCAQTVTLGQG